MSNPLAVSHLLSIRDLDKQAVTLVLDQAGELEEESVRGRKANDALAGRILAPLFYESAPWVRASFESAMLRLGGAVLSMAGLTDGSLSQDSHALSQTARVASAYADVIVHRHPDVYSAHEAAKGARVPLVNAGDGTHEDPVQALIDLYTLQKERGGIDGLSIAIVGDLRHSRAAHSLAWALTHWDVTLNLVSPRSLKMATVITVPVKRSLSVTETEDLTSVLETCDVVYVTGGQGARFGRRSGDEKELEAYRIENTLSELGGREVTVMCSSSGTVGVSKEIEELPGVAIYRQVSNGVWVRMALLALLLAPTPQPLDRAHSA
jgi:aspartate carbamoyltransferase catalytic subunit